jgi:S-formylglutathione hydrolase FrmB
MQRSSARPRRKVRSVTLAVITSLLAAASAWAIPEDAIRCHALPQDPTSYHGSSPRVRAVDVAGVTTLVLVPPDYDTSGASYPVVYLLQGGINHVDCFLGKTDLIEFTASQPQERHAIVVMPDVLSGPVWAGRANRAAAEQFFVKTLVGYIDSHYRTRVGRAFRSIAGFSAGGLGALNLAGRYPDVFSVAAGLSAAAEVNELDAGSEALGLAASLLITAEGEPDPFAEWGNPATEPMGWHEVNPVDMASNYAGVALTLFAGDGTPCDAEDLEPDTVLTFWPPMFWAAEAGALEGARHLSAALDAAGVAHVFDAYGCGVHSYRYVQRDLHTWWQPMFEAFGSPAPALFDHRRADVTFSVWGWTFTADPARAPEFLDIADAACHGVGLSGSGMTQVTTAPCFEPGDDVVIRVAGFSEQTVTAGSDGRVTFTVDLGPPHEHQQYTPAARALESAGGYWTSRAVTFEVLP